MSLISKLKIRSKKYLHGAKDQPCVRCGCSDGTIVAAHYTGMRSNQYGKGTGTKCHDVASADLCRRCHEHFDNAIPSNQLSNTERWDWKTSLSEDFLHCCMLTLFRRIENGVIYTDDISTGE